MHLAPNDGYVTSTQWQTELKFFNDAGLKFDGGVDNPIYAYKSIIDMSYYEAALGKPKGV